MSPETWGNVSRIGQAIVYGTMAYIMFVVWWAWMKDAERERKIQDREAEAFEAGYLAGRRNKPISSSYYDFQAGRKNRDRQG